MKREMIVGMACVLAVGGAVAGTAMGQVKSGVLKSTSFPVPTPAKAEHPGAEAAPASSPKTYPLEADFQKRADVLFAGLATNDLQTWRKGYFAGGDPGKYTHGPIMAKLLLDAKTADAVAMQNDGRSVKEQYHFATVNWSRSLPLFGSVLTEKSLEELDKAVGKYGYLGQGGTENHLTMWVTAANVLPWYTKSGRLQNMGKDAALAEAKKQLRYYVKNVFAYGNGEWDSSTYMMFTMNGLMNIYDFSKDEEARLLAKAALDRQCAAYALKYTDGVFCGPNQRGYAGPTAAKAIADQTGWLWWGSKEEIGVERTKGFLYAPHAATSSWRPNKVLTNIALRKLPVLPFESKNEKSSYWGMRGEPRAGAWDETLYVTGQYTMGSLQKGFGGQATRFMIVARTAEGPVVFTGGSPVGKNDGDGSLQFEKFADGNGMFDQTLQVGGTYLSMAKMPGEEWQKEYANKDVDKQKEKLKPDEKLPAAARAEALQAARDKIEEARVAKVAEWMKMFADSSYSFFAYPETVKPSQVGEWFVFQAGDTFVGVKGIGGKGEVSATPADKKGATSPLLKFAGSKSGFVVETGDTTRFKTKEAFGAALGATRLDTSKFAGEMAVSYVNVGGRSIRMKYAEGEGRAEAEVDSKDVTPSKEAPVYDGPYVSQNGGVLSVNDGVDGFVIDFTGDLPVYKAWKK